MYGHKKYLDLCPLWKARFSYELDIVPVIKEISGCSSFSVSHSFIDPNTHYTIIPLNTNKAYIYNRKVNWAKIFIKEELPTG